MPDTPAFLPFEAAEKLLAAAVARGVDRATLLARAGIAEDEARIGPAALCALYEEAARLTGDDSFGLHVGERTSPNMYGPLGYVAANSATLGSALASLADHQSLWSRAAGIALRRGRRTASLRYWLCDPVAPDNRRHESEQMLAALSGFMRAATAGAFGPREIRFEHRRPANVAEHRRLFGAPLVFGAAATEILFDPALLDLPMPHADPVLGELLRRQAAPALADLRRREPFLDRLRERLKAAILGDSEVSLAAAAAVMNMGPRTLQRRLQDHGLTFRTVVEDMRITLAKELLAQPGLALGQIAFQLGYSQTSALHRAFRRHAGATPAAFRRALAAREERA